MADSMEWFGFALIGVSGVLTVIITFVNAAREVGNPDEGPSNQSTPTSTEAPADTGASSSAQDTLPPEASDDHQDLPRR